LDVWLEEEPDEPADLLQVVDDFARIREAIKKEISKNEKYYQLLSPFKSQTNKNIMAMLGRVFNYVSKDTG
jgi:hypothetical protein